MPLNEIAEGWFNILLNSINLLNEDMKDLGEKRLSVCMSCPIRTEGICDSTKSHRKKTGENFYGCGCHVAAKVLCKDCKCPGGFW